MCLGGVRCLDKLVEVHGSVVYGVVQSEKTTPSAEWVAKKTTPRTSQQTIKSESKTIKPNFAIVTCVFSSFLRERGDIDCASSISAQTATGAYRSASAGIAERNPHYSHFWRTTMNLKKTLTIAALFAVSGTVFAGDLLPFTELDNFKSSKTRAEVKAEVAQQAASQFNTVARGELMGDIQTPVAVETTRSKNIDRANAIEAAKNGKSAAVKNIGS
jgi:hypothetical protein